MTRRLLLLPGTTDAAAIELTVADDGRILARSELRAPAPMPASPAQGGHLVVVPGTAVRAVWLTLPSRHPAQVLAAARLALEDHISGDAASMHVAIDHAADPAVPRCVLVVAHDAMQDWLAHCAALGIRVDALLPDYLLLPPPDDDAVHVAHWRGQALVRGQRLAFSAEQTLAETVAGTAPQRHLGEGDAVERIFAQRAALAAPDLVQGPYAQSNPGEASRRRRLTVLAILALLSPALVSGGVALRHAIAAKVLQSRATQLVAEHHPRQSRGAEPRAAVEALVSQATWPDTLAHRAGTLFAAIAQSPGTFLDNLTIERNQALQAGVQHRDAAALDAIRMQLGDAGLDAVVLDTQPVGQQWRSEISVEARP